MMEDNEKNNMIVKKSNIFTKMFDFLKSLFSGKTPSNSTSAGNKAVNTDNTKNEFNKSIKIENSSDPVLLELQEKIENNEIDISKLSDEEFDQLTLLYEKQISNLHKTIDGLSTDVNMLKMRLANSKN